MPYSRVYFSRKIAVLSVTVDVKITFVKFSKKKFEKLSLQRYQVQLFLKICYVLAKIQFWLPVCFPVKLIL